MILVLGGMAEGFIITRGFGDSSDEPSATPPDNPKDSVLGLIEGGLAPVSNQSAELESE